MSNYSIKTISDNFLDFLAGDYLVAHGTGADQARLADEITGKVFGGML